VASRCQSPIIKTPRWKPAISVAAETAISVAAETAISVAAETAISVAAETAISVAAEPAISVAAEKRGLPAVAIAVRGREFTVFRVDPPALPGLNEPPATRKPS
jgi:hypothetical protein